MLVLSVLAMESAHSIRFLYRHFLSGITEKSLNAFYYACSYAKVDYSRFMNVTAAMALKLVPERLRSQPAFLCIDDTMAAKFGKKSEDVQGVRLPVGAAGELDLLRRLVGAVVELLLGRDDAEQVDDEGKQQDSDEDEYHCVEVVGFATLVL